MKINPDNVITLNFNKAKRRKNNLDDNIFSHLMEEQTTENIENPTSVTPLSALLTLQEISDSNQETIEHGHKILRELKQLQLALVCGQVSTYNIELLQVLLAKTRQTCEDKQLLALLEEVELRAQIELLKLAKNYK